MGIFSSSEKTAAAGSKKMKEDGCVVTLQVEVPASKVQEAWHNALIRLQGQVRLPGFRPGKAPLDVLQRQLSGSAQEKAVDALLHDAIPKAIAEHRLEAVAPPAVHSIQFELGKPLVFQVDVETRPTIQVKDYKKMPLTRKKYPATDAEVDRRLKELQDGNARLERSSKESVAKDHYVVLDYEGLSNGKPVHGVKGQDELLDMSSSNAAEGLVEGILGAKRGEIREIASKSNGKPITFRVTVKEIKEKILPPLDDEFAKDLGNESLAELKNKLSALIEEEGRRKSEKEVLAQIEEGLLKRHKFAPPPSLVENALERMMERVRMQILGPRRDWPAEEKEKVRGQLRPKAEDEIRLAYLLRAVAAAEKIAVTAQDHDQERERSLQEAQTEEEKENIRKFFGERKGDIEAFILERKTMEFLKEAAAIQDA